MLAALLLLVGLVVLYFGAEWVVTGATDVVFFALALGVVLCSFLYGGGQTLSIWVLAIFAPLVLIYLVSLSSRREATEAEEPHYRSLLWPVAIFLLGVAALYIGGECAVGSAVAIAKSFGIDESIIGLTIVAAGTSVPRSL